MICTRKQLKYIVLLHNQSLKLVIMYQIFFGSLVLSLIHALIPNHWIPLIAISKTEKWSQNRTLWATAITGFAHTFSTIIVGIVVGIIGYKLSASYQFISTVAAPIILVSLGIIYLALDFRANKHQHHVHSHAVIGSDKTDNSKWRAILTSLSVAMFLTPCIEIEAYYFQAGTIGWLGIFIVSAVYLFITIIVMLLLVYLGLKGIRTFNSHFFEHHEKGLTGIVLVALGLFAYFVEF
jgi:nickel/cobalt transporter (NicO) family protein